MIYIVYLLFVGVTRAAIQDEILSLYRNKFTGDGTYYGPSDITTCQYNPPSLPPAAQDTKIKYLVALNKPQFLDSFSCGMCFKVHSNSHGSGLNPITGDFYVFADSLCPECLSGSLDLAANGDGRWGIEIQAVQCPVGETKIAYKFQGSNAWYVKLQIRNARIPAIGVKIMQNGHYISMTHTPDGFWEMGNGRAVDQNEGLYVQLTAANGEMVTDIIPELVNDIVLKGRNRVQFQLDQTLPTA